VVEEVAVSLGVPVCDAVLLGDAVLLLLAVCEVEGASGERQC